MKVDETSTLQLHTVFHSFCNTAKAIEGRGHWDQYIEYHKIISLLSRPSIHLPRAMEETIPTNLFLFFFIIKNIRVFSQNFGNAR